MKKAFILFAFAAAICSCRHNQQPQPEPQPETQQQDTITPEEYNAYWDGGLISYTGVEGDD